MYRSLALFAVCLLTVVGCGAEPQRVKAPPHVLYVFEKYKGAATASIEERIWLSDVVVHNLREPSVQGR